MHIITTFPDLGKWQQHVIFGTPENAYRYHFPGLRKKQQMVEEKKNPGKHIEHLHCDRNPSCESTDQGTRSVSQHVSLWRR